MMVFVHPAATLLRGDESYNARDLRVMPAGDQMEIVEGVYVDDGARPAGFQRRPDRPFRILVPKNANHSFLNMEVFNRLQRGDSLINLDLSQTPRR